MKMKTELRTKKFFLKYTECNISPLQALKKFQHLGQLNLYFIGKKIDPFGNCGLYAYLEYENRILLKSNKFNLDSFQGEYFSCNQKDDVINFIVSFDTYITNQGKQNHKVDQEQEHKETEKKNKDIDKFNQIIDKQLDQLIEQDQHLFEVVNLNSGQKQKIDSFCKNSASNNESSELTKSDKLNQQQL